MVGRLTNLVVINVKKEKSFIRQLLFLSLFLSCVHTQFQQIRVIPSFEVSWQEIEDGVSTFSHTIKDFPLEFYSVKIDLTKIMPFSTIKLNDRYIAGETTRQFAIKNDCLVAVNMSPFSYPLSPFHTARKISGLYILDGTEISAPLKDYAGLLFFKNGSKYSAKIVDSQIEVADFENVHSAFGGFWTILKDKQILPFKNYQNSRTALGYSDNGSVLYILVVSGEDKKRSTGASFEETARIILQLGATDAVMMDGGGSSSLVIRKKLMNQDTKERVVGNNLGFIKKTN
ncbi:MAG: phosphodiester glycosidase family protein [Treponemataceae bacterium]